MKIIKDGIINIGSLLLLIYLPFAFIINEYNPTKWDIFARAVYMITVVAAMTYAIKEYKNK